MAKMNSKTTTNKKKQLRSVTQGRLYVSATFNNTLVSVTDEKGQVICWSSTGESGFSGSRKSTPYAATIAVENALNKARAYGLQAVDIYVKGPGPGRDVALRVVRAQKLRVGMLVDNTPVPHNGTRPRKPKHNR